MHLDRMCKMSMEQLEGVITAVALRLPADMDLSALRALPLRQSVVATICVMRRSMTQELLAAVFGCCQATISGRHALLLPLVQAAMAEYLPTRGQIERQGTILVDGTPCPVRDLRSRDDLYSG